MKKMFISLMSIIFLLGCNLFSGSKDYKSAEYTSIQDVAQSGQETKIELDDGAAIIIPANAIDSQVSIKVERNPEKASSLPPFDENLVKVGDFYNFEIDGTINGPVDLVLPFNPELVPENEAGVLVVAIPTDSGWKYIPVVPDGNKVTLYTDQIGDPLIAWHFACTDRTDLSYEGHPDTTCENEQAKKSVCDPEIALDVNQNGNQFEVVGNVIPVAKNFFGGTVSEPAANITVTLNLNLREVGSGQKFSVQTDENGSFSYKLDTSKLKEGWNWVFAKAECDPWWGKIVVESNGYTEFKYTPQVVEQPISTSTPQSTESPVATIIPAPTETLIPTGAVLLPDFVGQPIDNAINWLESNGFKYTWIDGSSAYDLGAVYKQAPAGGQYKVPHRTVVVLYRTTETIQASKECIQFNLTPEECENSGSHSYTYSEEVIFQGATNTCTPNDGSVELDIIFSSEQAVSVINNSNLGWLPQNLLQRTEKNSYVSKRQDFNANITSTVTFTKEGFLLVVEIHHIDDNYHACTFHVTYTLKE